MPSRAKRDKERRWKLARNAVWDCVPARLGSEVSATWVPATELVPGGERAPWSSRSWGNIELYRWPFPIQLYGECRNVWWELTFVGHGESTIAPKGP